MRPFRFGVVAAPQGAERWVADVKRIADLGYSTVLMPDGVQLLSPFSSLAVAATVAATASEENGESNCTPSGMSTVE